jgi:hypothetical protein
MGTLDQRAASAGALLEVSDGDHIGIALQHVKRVFDETSIEISSASHFRIGKAHNVSAQTMHSGFRRKRVRVLG